MRVLTFNIFQPPLIAGEATEAAWRLHKLIEHVSRLRLDVVGLQEVLTATALSALLAQTGLPAAGLPHIAHFCAGSSLPGRGQGSGLILASRYPILETTFHAFAGGGGAALSLRFDAQTGKGVGLARLLLPDGSCVDAYVTHLIAQYADGEADTHAALRALQAFEVANFVRATRRAPLALLLADLNAGPAALPCRALSTLAGLTDAYAAYTPANASSLHLPTDATFGIAGNSFAARGCGHGGFCARLRATPLRCDVEARLDYVLLGVSETEAIGGSFAIVDCGISCTQPLTPPQGATGRCGGVRRATSLSDHAAVFAEIASIPAGTQPPAASTPLAARDGLSPSPPLGTSSLQPASQPHDEDLSLSPPSQRPTAFFSLPSYAGVRSTTRKANAGQISAQARPQLADTVSEQLLEGTQRPAVIGDTPRGRLLEELRATFEMGARSCEMMLVRQEVAAGALALTGYGAAAAVAVYCSSGGEVVASGAGLAGALVFAGMVATSALLGAPSLTAATALLAAVATSLALAAAAAVAAGGVSAAGVGAALAIASTAPLVHLVAVFLIARDASAFHAGIECVHSLQVRRTALTGRY